MKAITNLLVISLAVASITGCKKNEDNNKDYLAMFANTVWSGEINIRGGVEPFSIAFKTGGSLEWYEAPEDLAGIFAVDNSKKEIIITLAGNRSAAVTATITNDNRLTDLKYAATYTWTIANLSLNTSTEQPLDNTTWKGQFEPSSGNLELNFLNGMKLNGHFAGKDATNISYNRKAGCIRFTYNSSSPANPFHYFAVLSGNKMLGVQRWIGVGNATWSVTKQ